MESVILLAMKIAHHRGRPLKDFVQETAGRIAARDAEIRRECAERAVRYFEDSGLGFEYDGMAITPNYDLLRAAIIGEGE